MSDRPPTQAEDWKLINDLTAERDALRAEVERWKADNRDLMLEVQRLRVALSLPPEDVR